MSELRDLYQEVILDHGKHPRNFRFPEPSSHEAQGYNPLCGDRITVKLRLKDDVIEDVGFQGQGCAISQAACSTMTEAVRGHTVEEAKEMFDNYRKVVTGEDGADVDMEALGKLAVFQGVAEFPMRVKCATLAWHTLQAALEGRESATTE